MSAASTACQRWNRGSHTWRHLSEGGFDARRFDVVTVHESIARPFVHRHHYASSYPAGRLAFALTTDDERLVVDGAMIDGRAIVGIATLSVPMTAAVLLAPFPELEPYRESLELGRFVLTDTPANAESFFLGRVLALAAEAGIRGVVTFADPMPRRRRVVDVDELGSVVEREEQLTPGHVGVIYQATNAIACGRSTARTLHYLPTRGTVLSARTLQKIRAGESGAEAGEKALVGLGAAPRRAGQPAAAWLRQALEDLEVQRVRHPGNFRYAWALGGRRSRPTVQLPHTPNPRARFDLMPLEETR